MSTRTLSRTAVASKSPPKRPRGVQAPRERPARSKPPVGPAAVPRALYLALVALLGAFRRVAPSSGLVALVAAVLARLVAILGGGAEARRFQAHARAFVEATSPWVPTPIEGAPTSPAAQRAGLHRALVESIAKFAAVADEPGDEAQQRELAAELREAHDALDELAGEAIRARRAGPALPVVGDPRVQREVDAMTFQFGQAIRAQVAHGQISAEHARARLEALRAHRRYVARLLELSGEIAPRACDCAPIHVATCAIGIHLGESVAPPSDDDDAAALLRRATAHAHSDPVAGILDETAGTLELLADAVNASKRRVGPDPEVLAGVLEQHGARLRVAGALHARIVEALTDDAGQRRVERAAPVASAKSAA